MTVKNFFLFNLFIIFCPLFKDSDIKKSTVEKIKSIVKEGCIVVELIKGKITYKANLETEVYQKQHIDDFQNRATFFAVKSEEEQPELKTFVEEIDNIKKIGVFIEENYSRGNFKYRQFKKKFNSANNIQKRLGEIKNCLSDIERDLSEWEEKLKKMREKNYYMNFIQGKNFWLISDFLNSQLEKNSMNAFKSLLEFVEQGLSKVVLSSQKSSLQKYLPVSIESISNFIIDMTKENNFKRKVSNISSNFFQTEKANIFTVFEEEEDTVSLIVSLFNGVGLVPSPNNFLFANKFTNIEQIDNFINGCFKMKERNLFVICNCQDLPIEKQQNLSKFIDFMRNNNDQANLALFHSKSSEKSSYLSQKFQKIDKKIFKVVDLNEYYQQCGVSISFVSSPLSGMGKTHFIENNAGNSLQSFNISGVITGRSVIKMIECLNENPRSLHIILSGYSQFSFSLFLFQMTVLKVVQSNLLFQWVPQKLKIFVEISNTIGERLIHNLKNTLQKFEHKVLSFETQFQNFEIPKQIDSNVQIVCNYLSYFQSGRLPTTTIHYTNQKKDLEEMKCYVPPQSITVFTPLSKEVCLNLLKTYFWEVKLKNREEISINLLVSFINILSNQLRQFSNCDFLCEKSLISSETPPQIIHNVKNISHFFFCI